MSLSANEKAATFIGWKPEAPEAMSSAIAPDMSDPRNYMKALAEVAEHHLVRLTVNSKTSGVIWTKIGIACDIDERSPVEALVALYDAEHPQPDRGPV